MRSSLSTIADTAHTPAAAQVSVLLIYAVIKRNHLSPLSPPARAISSGSWRETPEVWSEDERAHLRLYPLSFLMFLCFTLTVNLTSCCRLRAASPSVRASLTSPDTHSSSRQISSHSKRPVKHTSGFLSPFIGQKVCRCLFKPAAGEDASPTKSSASGLEADPLQLRCQAGPQLLQNLLHPLGL